MAPNITNLDVTPNALPSDTPPPTPGPAPTPPDIQAAPTADAILSGTSGPAAPPRGTVGSGFKTGFLGPKYTVSGTGNVENGAPAEISTPASKLGTILGTLAMGALTSLGGVKQGVRGGAAVAQGERTANAALQDRDEVARQRAQQNLANKQGIQKAADIHQTSLDASKRDQAETAMENANTVKAQYELARLQKNAPLEDADLATSLAEHRIALEKSTQDLYPNPMGHFNNIDDAMKNPTLSKQLHLGQIIATPSFDEKGNPNGIDLHQKSADENLLEHDVAIPGTVNVVTDKNGKETIVSNNDGYTLKAGQATAGAARKARDLGLAQNLDTQKSLASIQQSKSEANKNNAEANKANLEARITADLNPPASNGKVGEDYLQSLPPARQATLRAVGEGRQIMSPRQLQAAGGQTFADAVNRAYPGYDWSKADTYAKARTKFGTGAIADKISARNTLMGHLADMNDHITAASVLPGFNWVTGQLGSKDAAAIDNDRIQASQELAQAYLKSAVTDTEEKQYSSELASKNPLKLRNSIAQIATLLEGKIKSDQSEWDNATPLPGIKTPIPLLNDSAKAAYNKILGNKSPYQTALPPAPAGQVSVQIPGQAPGFIPNQFLDAFKQKHPDAIVSQ